MEIIGDVKNYEWGKIGESSLVAQLAAKNSNAFHISDSTPYSELWMGNHPNGKALIKSSKEPIDKILTRPVPFLLKVLSIRKALSIQVHPNKAEAERLHKERPDIYKDPNHKPELAIALTPFKVLCGFRPYPEIYQFCHELPSLRSLIGDDNVESLKSGSEQNLRNCYEKLMTAKAEQISTTINCIFTNYGDVLLKHNLQDVFETINKDFPNDVGVLSLFFLNFMVLNPGEAIFLGANEIHAYISGDCIECMACSDNVVRAGLTPKYKDVNQLIACLNYIGAPLTNKIFKPKHIDENVQLFVPPVKDFAVAKIRIPMANKNYKLKVPSTDSILLILQGDRILRIKNYPEIIVKTGSIVYIPPEAAPEIEIASFDNQSSEEFIAYQGMENSFS